jgi:hypothetical protein
LRCTKISPREKTFIISDSIKTEYWPSFGNVAPALQIVAANIMLLLIVGNYQAGTGIIFNGTVFVRMFVEIGGRAGASLHEHTRSMVSEALAFNFWKIKYVKMLFLISTPHNASPLQSLGC